MAGGIGRPTHGCRSPSQAERTPPLLACLPAPSLTPLSHALPDWIHIAAAHASTWILSTAALDSPYLTKASLGGDDISLQGYIHDPDLAAGGKRTRAVLKEISWEQGLHTEQRDWQSDYRSPESLRKRFGGFSAQDALQLYPTYDA